MRLREDIDPCTAGDGMELNLIRVRGETEPTSGPVILVHGAGVRANIFRAPTRRTLVDALVEHGYDVWLSNWRASIDFPPNRWTLDQAARFDHPEAAKRCRSRPVPSASRPWSIARARPASPCLRWRDWCRRWTPS